MKEEQITGPLKIGAKTKKLVKRLHPGDIAVIKHCDLDEVAARSLVSARPAAVINTKESISGRYPNQGPKVLVDNGMYLLDKAELDEGLKEGDRVTICGEEVYHQSRLVGGGELLDKPLVRHRMQEAEENLEEELDRFVENTLEYARREKGLILGWFEPPSLETRIEDRHVLVVVRGQNYRRDLEIIASYVRDVNPIIIGVDGGADAVLAAGFRPDIIVGDMDSVSEEALRSCRERVVHAYPNGQAPGMKRLREKGLPAKTFAAPGTSEDIALLMAYENNASLIVAVGTHSNMIDFLEKGRQGMASTFLVRLKVGPILVDARGVNKLYRTEPSFLELSSILLAALFPVGVAALVSLPLKQYLRLLVLRFWVLFGI